MTVIFTVFAGRKNNLEVLNRYLKQAMEKKIIDEVHYWNYTRDPKDEEYLRSISHLRRISTDGIYREIHPVISSNYIELAVMTNYEFSIKLVDKSLEIEYEIVIGGWNTRRTTFIRNKIELFEVPSKEMCDYEHIIMMDHYTNIKIMIINGFLCLFKELKLIARLECDYNFKIDEVFVKSSVEGSADITYETKDKSRFYFMDTCQKSPWHNYYNYYDQDIFRNDIVLKCDDDILYMDLNKLPHFIDYIRYDNKNDIVFANIINNGVCAYYQQNKYGLIPNKLMKLEYPNTMDDYGNFVPGLFGSLTVSGKKAELIHDYFLNNYETFLNYDYSNEVIPIETRFSINFFGIKCKNWHKIRYCGNSDEANITVDYVRDKRIKNVLYTDFYVAHLSFGPQSRSMDTVGLQKKYMEFYEKLYG